MFLKILLRAKQIYQIEVYCYCLTHNHVHLLIGTPREANLSKFMQYLNGNFARAYNKRHGKTGRFWGGRFHSTIIETTSQLFNTMLYIELNMVRCKSVGDPAAWKWSSYRAHALGEKDPVLDFHELYLALGETDKERQAAYRSMVQERIGNNDLQKQPAFSRGIVIGSQGFIQAIIKKYGEFAPFYRNRRSYSFARDSHSLRKFKPSPSPGNG